ncbi:MULTISPECIES: UDP-glucose 4-epimerase family protein [Aeromonas]|uniref:UDP-glucose 4-epimerase family protein n=1 Tax=Aeromonas TaxID=642 RepID=UPI002A75B3E7|nr:SDR family oxidoreductase [Aeromonas jandaei]
MILLTGATGFVGRSVLKNLIKSTMFSVRTFGRALPFSELDLTQHVYGNLGADVDYTDALLGSDVVIHCAAMAHVYKNTTDKKAEFNRVNCAATIKLAKQAVEQGVKRFIFISSIGVNGGHNQQKPFRFDDTPQPWDDYTESKCLAEFALRELASQTGLEVVIIRPPLIYGAKAPGNFGKLTHAVRHGRWLPLGAIHNQRSFVALDNLVDLIITCVTHPHATNQTFLVSDDQDVSTTQLLEKMSRAAGKSPRLLPVPMSWLRLAGKLTGKQAVIERLCGNLQVDINHTKTTLGWQPPISLEEGIKRCFIEDKEGC